MKHVFLEADAPLWCLEIRGKFSYERGDKFRFHKEKEAKQEEKGAQQEVKKEPEFLR